VERRDEGEEDDVPAWRGKPRGELCVDELGSCDLGSRSRGGESSWSREERDRSQDRSRSQEEGEEGELGAEEEMDSGEGAESGMPRGGACSRLSFMVGGWPEV